MLSHFPAFCSFIWVKPFRAYRTALEHTLTAALLLQSARRQPFSHPPDRFCLAPIFPIFPPERLRDLHQPVLSLLEQHQKLVKRILL